MVTAIICTIAAWFLGLVIEANIGLDPLGFWNFGTLFAILTMGGFILHELKKQSK